MFEAAVAPLVVFLLIVAVAAVLSSVIGWLMDAAGWPGCDDPACEFWA